MKQAGGAEVHSSSHGRHAAEGVRGGHTLHDRSAQAASVVSFARCCCMRLCALSTHCASGYPIAKAKRQSSQRCASRAAHAGAGPGRPGGGGSEDSSGWETASDDEDEESDAPFYTAGAPAATLAQLAAMYGDDEGGLDPNRCGCNPRLLDLGKTDATLAQVTAMCGGEGGGLDPNRRGSELLFQALRCWAEGLPWWSGVGRVQPMTLIVSVL